MEIRKEFLTIMEHNPNAPVAFQGSKGSFSEQACNNIFLNNVEKVAFDTFASAYAAVKTGACKFGVLPIENTLIGTIHPSFDTLCSHKELCIVGDETLKIEHSLIGFPDTSLEAVESVYSQWPGFDQCSIFLNTMPTWKQIPFKDTAAAVGYVAEQKNPKYVAIASSQAASVYNLQVLLPHIENNSNNYTRFAVVVNKETAMYHQLMDELQNRTIQPNVGILVFISEDKPGSLLRCLKVFEQYDINLHKIESRPIVGKPWEYQFIIEMDIENKSIDTPLKELETIATSVHILGTYHRYEHKVV